MGSFVHCNVQYFYFYFLMNHSNDFAPCEPSIGQYKFLFLYTKTCFNQTYIMVLILRMTNDLLFKYCFTPPPPPPPPFSPFLCSCNLY